MLKPNNTVGPFFVSALCVFFFLAIKPEHEIIKALNGALAVLFFGLGMMHTLRDKP